MLTLLRRCLLLTALATSVSSKPSHFPTTPSVYSNCSGNDPVPLPHSATSSSFFQPQIHKNGPGWEEWVFLAQNRLPDGTELIYSYKWTLGDPTTADASQHSFVAWALFPNGTFYHEVVNDGLEYEQRADGGFTYSVGGNRLIWDPAHGFWNTSVNAAGLIIEVHTGNVAPDIPYAPNYKSVPGQLADGFFSRLEAPRGHSDGYMTFPWGLNVTIGAVTTLKHSWSHKVISDTISAYVRGSTFFPAIPPLPVATVNWFQAWDCSGNEIDSMQFLIQPENDPTGQVFRTQITDAPKVLSIVTTPSPSPSLSFNSSELTLPMCGPGADPKKTHENMVWKANNMYTVHKFVDLAGGVTLYQRVNMTGVLWFNSTATELPSGGYGIGIVEVYHK